jgi:hypothetical protein
MSKQQNSPCSFTAGEALEAFRRVKMSGATVVYADAGERGFGTTQAYVANGGQATIRLDTEGTAKMTAAGTFAAGATVYAADDGKIDDVVVGKPVGKSPVAATAAGDILEVVPVFDESAATATALTFIYVSPDGDDSSGNGSFSSPYATVTTALAAVSATRKTIMLMPGEYIEAASLTWPSRTGVRLCGVIGDGDAVTIIGTAGQTQVISIDPTVQTATFEATISNVGIECPDGVRGITFDNTSVNRKINLYLFNVPISNDTETDRAISVVHTTAGEAMRIYASGQKSIVEGLLYIAPKNTDDRFTFDNYQFDGGVQFGTTTIASVSTFKDCIMKDGGGSGGQDTQILNSLGCYSLTGTTYAAAALADFASNAAEVIA